MLDVSPFFQAAHAIANCLSKGAVAELSDHFIWTSATMIRWLLPWLGELQPLLRTRPSLDLRLQFCAQAINGWYLPCADDAGDEVIEEINACLRQASKRQP